MFRCSINAGVCPVKVTLVKSRDNSGKVCFYPVDDAAIQMAKKFGEAEWVIVDMVKARNPGFHRKAFAILHMLHDMADTDMHFEPFRRLLTIKAGYYTAVGSVSINGDVRSAVYPDSLAFESMDEDEFQKTISAMIDAWLEKFGTGVTHDELERAAFAL